MLHVVFKIKFYKSQQYAHLICRQPYDIESVLKNFIPYTVTLSCRKNRIRTYDTFICFV